MNRDRLTKVRRSWNMSRIRGKHTTPEKVVRSLLHRLGYRFRLHVRFRIILSASTGERKKGEVSKKFLSRVTRHLPAAPKLPSEGRSPRFVCPDILLPQHKTAIFVHGCFWHRHRGCKNCTTPTHRREWWLKKLEGNAARDKLHQRALRKLGWRAMVVWECETEKPERLARLHAKLKRTLSTAKERPSSPPSAVLLRRTGAVTPLWRVDKDPKTATANARSSALISED